MGLGLGIAVHDSGREKGKADEFSGKFLIASSNKRSERKGLREHMVECRICQEEGEEGDMEAPCACNGTIKFAHRRCVQRWCNRKGNIICEICNQAYAPDYINPPRDCMVIDIRQGWAPLIDLDAPHFFTISTGEQHLLHIECDNFSVSNASTILCCRYMTLLLMLLLIVRQVLVFSGESGTLRDLSILVNISILQYSSFLILFYLIGRSFYAFQYRWRRQH